MSIDERTDPTSVPEFDSDALREKYRMERDKRLRPDGNTQYIEIAGRFAPYLHDPYVARVGATRAPRRRHRRDHRRRLCGPHHRRQAPASRHRRRADHRKGRRLRRHLVLEPLSGRPMRRGVVCVSPLLGRDVVRPEREVRPRSRDPRPLSSYRHPLRPLRRRLSLHGGHRHRVGRSAATLDDTDRSRRRHVRSVPHHGKRPSAPPQAAGHRGHRDVRWPYVPHQPLGLRLHGR